MEIEMEMEMAVVVVEVVKSCDGLVVGAFLLIILSMFSSSDMTPVLFRHFRIVPNPSMEFVLFTMNMFVLRATCLISMVPQC